jgi:tetratricopeptide (TPR) repeat protein
MAGRRFLSVLIMATAFLAAKADLVIAQSQSAPPGVREALPDTKPTRRSQRPTKTDRAARLNALYDALAKAPNAQIAKLVESKIEAAMMQSGSPTTDLLMARARLTMEAKDNKLAFELLDAIIQISPNFVEARAQRATLYYTTKDFARSLADIRLILSQEPRHYGALAGLGIILQDLGEDKRALEAFRRALAINPFMDMVPDMVKKLTVKVEGREI